MNLYARPANLFVAGFLGSPAMNFLRGRVVEDNGLHLATGESRIPLDATRALAARAHAHVGQELIAGLRPEDLVPATASSSARFDALLELIEPVGNEIFLNLRTANATLVARVPPQNLPKAGERIELGYDPARLHLFDPTTERRLE
jgi:multiple sugar transport system ATP-binding protein